LLRLTPLLLTFIGLSHSRDSKQFGFFGISNPFGILGHNPCKSTINVGGEKRVGECTNESECILRYGVPGGYCKNYEGVCCVHTNMGRCGESLGEKFGYFYNAKWPKRETDSYHCTHTVKPKSGTCFIRFDLLTLEMEQIRPGNCVHDRITIQGGKEASGQMCGDRSGEVTLIEVDAGKDVSVVVEAQSSKTRYHIGITQISCDEVKTKRAAHEKETYEGDVPCGVKNPSLNKIGDIDKKSSNPTEKRLQKDQATATKVFEKLKDLKKLSEFELNTLHRDVYRPSFPSQSQLEVYRSNVRRNQKNLPKEMGRIMYGNETDPNEYPWQISMWIDRSHFCGGTLINEEWIVTAAHCVDLQYKNHFNRVTVSLGDHDVQGFYEMPMSILRKLKRVVRFPTYDEHYLHGDLALLQLDAPVPFSSKILPACLPIDDNTWGYRTGLITGWGYTEETKKNTDGPKTASILREAEIFVMPQDICKKVSPFSITDRMICTYKGPNGVETTCQGDSGGPLVVNNGTNKFVLVGATSFGVAGCEGPYPSVFSRVSTFLDFIYAAMVPTPMEYLIDYSTPKIV